MSAHTTETQLKLIGKLLLEGELHCETGLHVGAGKGSLEIGSSDNPVIKDAFGRPYIPGSSLRGRLRSLLEQSSGLAVPAELVYLSRRRGQEVRIHQSDRPDDEICILFGRKSGRRDRVVGEAQDSSEPNPARLARSLARPGAYRGGRAESTAGRLRGRPRSGSGRRPERAVLAEGVNPARLRRPVVSIPQIVRLHPQSCILFGRDSGGMDRVD